MLLRRTMPFRGWTRLDGTRRATAPKNWPFGTVRPPVDYPVSVSIAKPRVKKKEFKP